MRLIIDASVMLASLLEDEPDHAAAKELLQRFLMPAPAQELELSSLSLLPYELANGLWQAVRRGRIAARDIVILLERFEHFSLPLCAIRPASIIPVAESLQCASAYDAAYLALAASQQIPLVTADKRLYNAVRERFRWITLLGAPLPQAD